MADPKFVRTYPADQPGSAGNACAVDVVDVAGGHASDCLAQALAIAVVPVCSGAGAGCGAGQPISLVKAEGVRSARGDVPGNVHRVGGAARGEDAIGFVVGVAGGVAAEHLAQAVAVRVVAVDR